MTTKTIRTQVTKSPTAVGRKDPSEILKKIISSSRNSNYLQKNPKLQQRWESGFGPKVAIDWLNPAEQINDFKTSDYPAKQRVPAIEQNSFRLLLQKDSLICDQACRPRWHKFEIFLEKQKFSRVHSSQKIFWVKSSADCSSHAAPRPGILPLTFTSVRGA